MDTLLKFVPVAQLDRASASGAENVCSNHTRGTYHSVDIVWIRKS